MNDEKTLKFIDLFAGIGGFRLGIERVFNRLSNQKQQERQKGDIGQRDSTSTSSAKYGYTQSSCVFSNEWDKYATQIYNKNFSTNIVPTDIRTINEHELPDFDFLCGGFPCQAFSIAGKRAGFNDTRGTMFFEIARILKSKRPKFVLLENVKGLLNHDKGKTFTTIIQVLEELGYNVQWMVLNSKFHGVPQNRERVFIICNLTGEPRPQILPFKKKFAESTDREYVKEKKYINFLKKGQPLMGTDGVSQTINAQGFGSFGNTGLYMIKNVGNIYNGRSESGRVYDTEGIAPTVADKKSSLITGIDVSKKIKQRTTNPNQEEIRKYITEARKVAGITIDQIEEHFGNYAGHHWFEKNGSLPSVDDWIELKKLLQFDDKYDELMTSYRWTTEWELMNEHKERHQAKGNGFGYQIKTEDDEAGTLTSMEQGLNYNLIGRKDKSLDMIGNYQVEYEKRTYDIEPKIISDYLNEWLSKSKLTKKKLAEKLELPFTLVEHFFRKKNSISLPDKDVWLKLKDILGFDDKYDKEMLTFETAVAIKHQGNRIYNPESNAPTLNSTSQPIIEYPDIVKVGNHNPSGRGQSGIVIDSEGVSFTVTAGGNNPNRNRDCGYGMGKILDNYTEIRRLTPLECERLQGFPEGWTEFGTEGKISDTQRYKTLGNAVTVNVIEVIIENWFFRED